MYHSTSNTYQMKREILNFTKYLSKGLPKPDRKFMADMNYGILASGSCLLTDIADQLHEPSKKINIVDRLSRHLSKGLPPRALQAYLTHVKQYCPSQPVIHIDDSDVVKPDGYKFEALGYVRDGSESTTSKNVYKKGYHVTEATVLTGNNHPISIFSEIHSSKEKGFTSINDVTFSAIERGKALFGKATFVMDRGYDDNKMFLKLDSVQQDYVIRLTSKRKLLCHNRWEFATELRNRRKGKIKLPLCYKGKQQEAWLSHVKVQITALYFSRWRIEEYFRCKKQMFRFENFRVRKLAAINALNFYLSSCMAFLAHISMKAETNALKALIIKAANPIKKKTAFCYYRLAKGISDILSYAKEGVRLWFRTKRQPYRQLCLKLPS